METEADRTVSQHDDAMPAATINPERQYRWSIVATILLCHVGLCMRGATVHSPTVDEPAYLASGLSHWRIGRFDLCKVSPPLVRLLAAVPVLFARPKYDWNRYQAAPGVRSEHTVGSDFLAANGERSFWLFTLGRWACLPFTIAGAIVTFQWATALFGIASGYAALLLWCFSPNILAHAQLLTPDIGVTALCVTACYTFWRWSEQPSWGRTFAWGLLMGIALLAKTNAVVLLAGFPVITALKWFTGRRKRHYRSAFQFIVGLALATYTLNLGYGFEGSFRSLGDYEFFSRTLTTAEGTNRFRGSMLHSIPTPVPSAFLEGIDLQRRDFENQNGVMKTYLRGKWYDHGWWWYYFYVVAVKVPHGTLILCAVSPFLIRKHPRACDIFLYVAFPGLLLFGLPCSQTGFGHSLRYILPAAPFAFLIASSAFAFSNGIRFFVCGAILLSVLCSSLRSYPHTLSYFNELAGGPANGHFHLLDGNMDWGQDLLLIREWLKDHPENDQVYVSYWGFLPLRELGIEAAFPRLTNEALLPGTYLISVNHLRGEFRQRRPALQALARHPETGAISPSIRIIQVE